MEQHKVGSGPTCFGQGWEQHPGLLQLSWFSQPLKSDCSAQGLWLVPTATCVCCPPQGVTAGKISEGEPRSHWRFTALKGSSSHLLWLEKLVSSSFQGTDLYLKTPPSTDAGAWWAGG